MGPSLLE
ncbi:hypothetical protein CGLO_00441 [Colletotrichum gloeosporioides Cg-14]|nr:hypothetical protein CGLO_00441 [Colletotrichum gloeosporioides Cg-14]